MATPDFVLDLREKVGTDLLWLCGVTAVVLKGDQVLMVKRADNGAWTPVTGIVDPGEHPATAAMRETLEEAGIVAQVTRLARVGVTRPVTYENGDQTQYVDLTWRLEWRSGDPHPADGENTEARWFDARSLPTLSDDMARRIGAALVPQGEAEF